MSRTSATLKKSRGLPALMSLFADETGLGLIAALAEKHDAQVWIERASLGEECSVIIADGQVQDAAAETE